MAPVTNGRLLAPPVGQFNLSGLFLLALAKCTQSHHRDHKNQEEPGRTNGGNVEIIT